MLLHMKRKRSARLSEDLNRAEDRGRAAVADRRRLQRNRNTESVWSLYNNLFCSPRFGYFVYNSLSNTLFELDETHYRALEAFRDHNIDFEDFDGGFHDVMWRNNVITTSAEEKRLLLFHQYKRRAQNVDPSRLGLTICPTIGCNFRCPYCFESSQGERKLMEPRTVDRLISFIKSYKNVRSLSLAWFGGEPLLGFDIMCDITDRLKSLDLNFGGAALVTNGYFLDQRKCGLFNDMRIRSVQVTIDGPEEMHDQRRFLKRGGPTYRRILNNLDTLLNSTYQGSCEIRVNVDRQNADAFQSLQDSLMERFKGKRICIYAARVHAAPDHPYDQSRVLNMREWTNFNFKTFQSSGFMPIADFYPTVNLDSVCVATADHRFVVGPRGELYKCWEDVGNEARVIGNIHEVDPITNPTLRAQYIRGTDAYADPECLECPVLPICGGGCANKRLRTKQFGEKGLHFCSPYKEHLVEYLEAYIDTLTVKETCTALLNPGKHEVEKLGYRKISPETKSGCSASGGCSHCS